MALVPLPGQVAANGHPIFVVAVPRPAVVEMGAWSRGAILAIALPLFWLLGGLITVHPPSQNAPVMQCVESSDGDVLCGSGRGPRQAWQQLIDLDQPPAWVLQAATVDERVAQLRAASAAENP